MAYYLANRQEFRATLVVLCVIVPYFTNIIVRIFSWMVLPGRNGIVNQVLLGLGLVEAPLPLLYNKTSIVIGMSYVLLPHMVLTLYSVMPPTSLFLTGVRTQTLPVRIWNSLLPEVEPTIAAVSTFLIGVTAVVLLADASLRYWRRTRRRGGA